MTTICPFCDEQCVSLNNGFCEGCHDGAVDGEVKGKV
jgi:hypothetical protein